jgi:LPS sulfotransferase NodH
MGQGFRSFVVFAEMRTGSNFLESNLNALEGVQCLGEAFNPHFIGYPNTETLLGVTQAQRDSQPFDLLNRIEAAEGLAGFRYFHDHDPRILDRILDDPCCAKIMLSRNPLDSYVSWKIARTTGQWKLTDVQRRKEAKVDFDPVEFSVHSADLAAFRAEVLTRVQSAGQTVFQLRYEDLQSLDLMNGLACYLGVDARLEKLDRALKVQNPQPLSEKVSNPEQMEAALLAAHAIDLEQAPSFEPQRHAAVPTYVLGAHSSLMFMPIRGGPHRKITAWMAALDNVAEEELPTRQSQKQLRRWRRAHKGHRSFTVVRHPVARAHHSFCTYILDSGPQVYAAIRRTLAQRYGVAVPLDGAEASYDLAAHRAAFAAFLTFLKANLNGQTAIRVDPAWCTQAQAVQGFSKLASPDYVFREEDLPHHLPALAERLTGQHTTVPEGLEPAHPYVLEDIYDEEIEDLAAAAYQKDYLLFGFDSYR